MCRRTTFRLACGLFVAILAAQLAAEPVREPTPPKDVPLVESRVVLPSVTEAGGPVRVVPFKDYRIELDLSKQVLAVSTPKEESWRTLEEKFRPGDMVAVKGRGSKLRAGKEAVADLAEGQLLSVTEVKGQWLATRVVTEGKPRAGWVHSSEVRFHGEEPAVFATLQGVSRDCVGAALLAQKAKQFDDGLYAAVELVAQRGSGKFAGKVELLAKLADALSKAELPGKGNAIPTILAAGRLGGHTAQFDKPLEAAVVQTVATFRTDSLRAKPLAFYTWTPELTSIFQQDRMLQMELTGNAQITAVLAALHSDDKLRETYESYLKLVSGLTNPLAKADLRPLLSGLDNRQSPSLEDMVHFFPPSQAHETDLVMRLYGNRPIPEGFSLADELLVRIKSGDIDLTPRPTSGWYDYQTWSLEPLAIPDKMPEAARLKLDESYKKQLRELFKGVLALMRETHVKQLEFPAPAEDAGGPEPRPVVYVSPELTAEPLPSVYVRRAISYRFIRKVLEEAFGPEALKEIHRLTAAGPVKENLADELAGMESLMHGAYVTASLQIGLAPDANDAAGSADPAVDAARFLHWAANLARDEDVGQDARMMVPVFYDQQRRLTKAWVFLGWTQKRVNFHFDKLPGLTVLDKDGKPVAANTGPDVQFHGTGWNLAYPVVAEVYVSRLLDRAEFRRHCDTYVSQSVILKNLP